ncbi:DUF3298 domain-containing protein [Candidatus Borreliella tachyglossi]|uniref:DUF3298 domain-containing protein n=1 Tax=Candidatus Borreliella tachyglossi TaxID=1964448 RepID=A0A2S1LX25_9SPIR|nr:RsiV family protein [Candidatus Borreliella tachyglossi]AWG42832.1 DUF3298 domain-containing protein [Candidatus Borreliella tachyglossi]
MTTKYPTIIVILLLIISCSKSEKTIKNAEVHIETKIIKETGNYKNNNIFHIDAKIPIVSDLEFGLEELIKKWKINNETDRLEKIKPKGEIHEYFYQSDFEIFTNENLQITSILYEQYTITERDANGLTTYHPINLRGREKIELSDVISQDQLDSLIQVLREQVEKELKNSREFDIQIDTRGKSFEEIFNQYKYYFKNNNVIVFYDPLTIRDHASGKVEFTFPIENTEG